MQNIHEILKAYGLSIPDDKKAEFDNAIRENYKTVAEVEKINDKLTKANNELKEAKESLETTNTEFEKLKNSHASKEDWEKKYNDLVAENTKKEEEKAQAEQEALERAEFDNYYAEKQKEWANPFIADGYFGKFKEAKALPENKNKTTGDILDTLTKDDATAFKTDQPIITLKGAGSGLSGSADDEEARINAIMGIKTN